MWAELLRLTTSPRMRFEMTVYDSRFLASARRVEPLPLPGCADVEVILFELHDLSSAAMFQARRSAQWIDQRTISLPLSTTRHQVVTKQGHTLWPPEPLFPGVRVHAWPPFNVVLHRSP